MAYEESHALSLWTSTRIVLYFVTWSSLLRYLGMKQSWFNQSYTSLSHKRVHIRRAGQPLWCLMSCHDEHIPYFVIALVERCRQETNTFHLLASKDSIEITWRDCSSETENWRTFSHCSNNTWRSTYHELLGVLRMHLHLAGVHVGDSTYLLGGPEKIQLEYLIRVPYEEIPHIQWLDHEDVHDYGKSYNTRC